VRNYNPYSGTLNGGDGSQTTDSQIGAVVRTIAGTTRFGSDLGFFGDGGPASAAQLNSPMGLAVAPDGTLYFADSGNNRVRKIAPSGGIPTVVGNGTGCVLMAPQSGPVCGDGGPATQAALAGPVGVALGPDGSLYFSEAGSTNAYYGGRRIRRVFPSG